MVMQLSSLLRFFACRISVRICLTLPPVLRKLEARSHPNAIRDQCRWVRQRARRPLQKA